MKVKQVPEDFRVEEVSRLEPGVEGDFSLYRLEKSGIGTPEAVRILTRAWRLRSQDVAFAGLKDRYGLTGQTISVRRGPRRNLAGRGFKLNYLGRSPRPAARGTIAANRFRIVLRDLDSGGAERVGRRARRAAGDGFPNYFDDQRFGSLRGTGGAFVARALLDGDFEEALRLSVACPAREDRGRTRRRRAKLRECWGAWSDLAARLAPSLERRICRALAAGAPYADAYGLLDRALRAIHLGAFQAHLFNGGLRRAVGEDGPRHRGSAGPYLFYRGDPGALRGERIPLAAAGAPPHPLLDEELERASLTRARLSGLAFRRGLRAAVAAPAELTVAEPVADALNPGRLCLALSFALPPGSYATMLIKRCSYDLRRLSE
ncbi:MAG: tRNA pseudouridine(13) synthase TruD [Planctomycetota bacterium]